jgi:hypothetical protein
MELKHRLIKTPGHLPTAAGAFSKELFRDRHKP